MRRAHSSKAVGGHRAEVAAKALAKVVATDATPARSVRSPVEPRANAQGPEAYVPERGDGDRAGHN